MSFQAADPTGMAHEGPQNAFAVNESLTKRRVPPVCETPDFANMMRRMIRAHGRRVADGDIEDLAELIALRALIDEQITDAIHEMRGRHQRSWADIGEAAGVTRQRAHARWGKPRHG